MWFDLTFHGRVFVETGVLGGLSAFLGPHVLDRRLVYLTHAIGHAMFPGIALAAVLGIQLVFGGLVSGLVMVATLTLLTGRRPHRASAITGVLVVAGFALGMVLTSGFLSNTSRNLETFLVGQIVNVTDSDLVLGAALLVVAAVVTTALHGRLVFSAFDPDGYAASGHRGRLISTVALLLVTATTAVVAAQVGAILAVAVLVAAPTAARALVRNPIAVIILSWLTATGSAAVGASVSEHINIPTGPAIVIALGLVTTAITTVSWARSRRTPASPFEPRGKRRPERRQSHQDPADKQLSSAMTSCSRSA